jgi:peptidoglycan/xylan/chitin deacetylase (PgdA/CDA1 family)
MTRSPEPEGGASKVVGLRGWLPEGKRAAVVLTIDDIHPATSSDAYEAGGDLADGALGHVLWLLQRHPALHVTLFVTPDWRETSPVPTRRLPARIPGLRDRMYLAPVLQEGTMALDRHPQFVEFLASMPRTDIGVHGLHHVHRGPRIPVEYQDEPYEHMLDSLRRSLDIFERAGLPHNAGFQPPAWELPPPLERAAADLGVRWIAAARDIQTDISPTAVTAMSGPPGLSLIHPDRLTSGLLHLTNNFQATSPRERALEIVEAGGLLAIKAHIVKNACGHLSLDGVDRAYMNYLDLLFRELETTYGDELWWTTMAEVHEAVEARCTR